MQNGAPQVKREVENMFYPLLIFLTGLFQTAPLYSGWFGWGVGKKFKKKSPILSWYAISPDIW